MRGLRDCFCACARRDRLPIAPAGHGSVFTHARAPSGDGRCGTIARRRLRSSGRALVGAARFALRAAERQLQLQRRTVDSGSSTPLGRATTGRGDTCRALPAPQTPAYQAPTYQAPTYQAPAYQAPAATAPPPLSSPPPNSPPYTPPGGGWAPTSSVNGPPTTSLYNRETMQREAAPAGRNLAGRCILERRHRPADGRRCCARRTRARSGRKIIANAHGRSDPGCGTHAHDRAGFL